MALHKVSELEGALLDAAVAKALGWETRSTGLPLTSEAEWVGPCGSRGIAVPPAYSEWAHGGPLIDEFRITWTWQRPHSKTDAVCIARCERWDHTGISVQTIATMPGPDPLVASMRSLVASHFGEEVEL